MFQFLEELYEVAGVKKTEFNDKYKLCMLGGKILYVSNYIRILSYSTEALILKVKDNELNIEGVAINIKQLSGKEIIITGHINKIYLSKEYVSE